MNNYFIWDVFLTSLLTSAIVAAVVYLLFIYKHEVGTKKRVEGIIDKIKTQSSVFNKEVGGLKEELKKISDTLEIISKKKS